MKNFVKSLGVMAIMLLCYLPSNATHLMGGDIGITKDINGAYILEHVNFRDTLGIPAYAQTKFNAYKWDTTNSQWTVCTGTPQSALVMPMDSNSSGGLLVGIPYGIQIYNYNSVAGLIDTIFADNGPGKYLFYTEDCCRNLAILNASAPGSEKLVISCEYTYDPAPSTSEFSPEFLAIPTIYGPINNAWVYNPLPFDADGDSLSWALNTPWGNFSGSSLTPCAGYTTPPAATTGPFTLNSATGQINWTPNMLGNFIASFEITEYSGGVEIGKVVRDMQYVVIPDSNANGPVAMPEFVPVTGYGINNINTSSSYNYQYYYPGSPMTFTIGAMDQNNNDVLNMTAFSSLLNNSNAAFNYTPTGSGNMVHGTFTWTPPANETIDHMVVIRANDGSFSKDFTIVLKKFVAPTAVNDIDAQQMNITVYPNPAKANSAISFKVVSEEGMNNLDLRIVDLSGKIVATQEIKSLAAGVSTIQLNSQLQAGFYLAQFIDAKENKKQLIKFVVQ